MTQIKNGTIYHNNKKKKGPDGMETKEAKTTTKDT